MDANSLPKTVPRQRRGCDLNPGPSAPESSTLTTRLPSHLALDYMQFMRSVCHQTGKQVATVLVAGGSIAAALAKKIEIIDCRKNLTCPCIISPPHKCPSLFMEGYEPPPTTWFIGPRDSTHSEGILIGLSGFARLTLVTNKHTHRDRPRYV